MGFVNSLQSFIGFGIGIPLGLVVGFFIFFYYQPKDVKDPVIRPLHELDSDALHDILDEIPVWVKNPDYDRADWFNKFLSDMWPYLDKAICPLIREMTKPIVADYIGKYAIHSIEFETLSLGALPPTIYGIKSYQTNEKVLVIEPILRWAGNPNINVLLKVAFFQISLQLLDIQIFAAPRITLKPLVPTFPCFASVAVSLMEKPHVDFGMKVNGADLMAIPGLYRFVQETIKKQLSYLYVWPHFLEFPILDASVGATKKPVGILHVKVVRATKLRKMDLLGTSDPYVKLGLSGERLPTKKTTVKMKNLNPEWNEEFKLTVKDPESQVLQLRVYDWEKVGSHDKLGMQVVPLKLLVPNETKSFELDLLKSLKPDDGKTRKQRGQLLVELTFNPFKEDIERHGGAGDGISRIESRAGNVSDRLDSHGAGLLLIVVQGAEDVEGKKHNNPYALVLFRGEQRKTKMIRKTRDPHWDEEFQFVLEEAPVNDKIHVEIMSRRTGLSFRGKESLGYIDINLVDVVNNGRINEKYHLINSRNGVVHVEAGLEGRNWMSLRMTMHRGRRSLMLGGRQGLPMLKLEAKSNGKSFRLPLLVLPLLRQHAWRRPGHLGEARQAQAMGLLIGPTLGSSRRLNQPSIAGHVFKLLCLARMSELLSASLGNASQMTPSDPSTRIYTTKVISTTCKVVLTHDQLQAFNKAGHLDVGTLIGGMEQVATTMCIIQEEGSAFGIVLNLKKRRSIGLRLTHPALFPADMPHPTHDVKLLGEAVSKRHPYV